MAQQTRQQTSSTRQATCHPDKPVHAKGLCQPCYRRASHGVAASCHVDRPHYAKGLCSSCYWKERRATDGKVLVHVRDLSLDDQASILKNAICGICHTLHKKLKLDTDPLTGRLRGVLCKRCAAGIAAFKKDPKLVQQASDYLRPWVRSQSA